ncbi:MAG: hypothetical protein V3T18_04455 [Pseudomonadales bacterium]
MFESQIKISRLRDELRGEEYVMERLRSHGRMLGERLLQEVR